MTGTPVTPSQLRLLDALECVPPVDVGAFHVDDANLLPGLLALWSEWRRTAPRHRRDRAVRIECWLHACAEQGAVLTDRVPSQSPGSAARWLGPRLFFWPRGIPSGRRIGLVASRLGQALDAQQPVFRTMRQIVSGVATTEDVIVAADHSSLGKISERCCLLFDRRLLRIVVPSRKTSGKWLGRLVEQVRPGQLRGNEWPVFISPRGLADCETQAPMPPSSEPLQDAALALFSDPLFVLSVRAGGNLENVLRKRLSVTDSTFAPVRLAVGNGLCANEVVSQLQSIGAVCWSTSGDDQPANSEPAPTGQNLAPPAVTRSPPEDDEWLTHWTRRLDGPAPGESEDDMIDALILEQPESNRSALASLMRVLADGQLRASVTGLRGGAQAVSFSAVPLRELVRKRTYRVHRKRWDFEHVGICIRKRALEQLGARPVIYGDDDTWTHMPEGERLWFQRRFSHASTGDIDWSAEQEWRFPGNVDLSRFSQTDCFLFCPGNREAVALQSLSGWPIVTVESLLTG